MQVIWTNFAVKNLKEIFNYYSKRASRKVACKIRDNILSSAKQLNKNPKSGQIEFLFEGLDDEYRYLVNGNYKIVYRISNLQIVITDVFDTRQNPVKLNDSDR